MSNNTDRAVQRSFRCLPHSACRVQGLPVKLTWTTLSIKCKACVRHWRSTLLACLPAANVLLKGLLWCTLSSEKSECQGIAQGNRRRSSNSPANALLIPLFAHNALSYAHHPLKITTSTQIRWEKDLMMEERQFDWQRPTWFEWTNQFVDICAI